MHFLLSDAFSRAVEYAQTYRAYTVTFTENHTFLAGCSLSSFDLSNTSTPSELRELLAKFSEQDEEFSQIPVSVDLGLVRVHAHQLFERIRLSPSCCLGRMHQVLPEAYISACEALSEDMGAMAYAVGIDTSTIEEHVTLLKALERVDESIDGVNHR